MNIQITSVQLEKIDVTTHNFPGISEGKRDYLISNFIINYDLHLPTSDLSGTAKYKYDPNLTVNDLEKLVIDKITEEIKESR